MTRPTQRHLLSMLALAGTLAVAFEPAEPPAPPPEPREGDAPRLPKGDSNRAERRADEKMARRAAKRAPK